MNTSHQSSSHPVLPRALTKASQVKASSEAVTSHFHLMNPYIYISWIFCVSVCCSTTRHSIHCYLDHDKEQSRHHLSQAIIMPAYASSAPATDRPDSELEEFPSVSKISKKVKMNPFAPVFQMDRRQIDDNLLNSMLTETAPKSGKQLTNRSIKVSDQPTHSAQDAPTGYESMAQGHSLWSTDAPYHIYAQDSESQMRSQSSIKPYVYTTAIPPEYQTGNIVTRPQTSARRTPYEFQSNAMTASLDQDQEIQDDDHSEDYIYLLPAYQPRDCYQQNAPSPYQYQTSSPFTTLTQRPYNIYSTHLYGRLHPANPQFLLPFRYATPGFYQHLAPLPPSYPFPQLTPPEVNIPVPTSSTPGRHIRLRPYNNVPMAEHYLSLFTDLYGTSPTSLPSLHAICLTLSHPPETLPKTIRDAQKYIKRRYVNIFDLVDYGVKGEAVPEEFVFLNAQELRRYSEETRKVCPAEVGRGTGEAREEDRGNELWRWMLRKWY